MNYIMTQLKVMKKKKSKFNKACKLIGLFNLSKKEWESLKKSKISVSENYIKKKLKREQKLKIVVILF